MSIGDALAQARRQAGLTITQVSQRTCIRETIIRGIERGDYSACGGDFYARGHVRSIARAVGADPDSLIREYDLSHGAPQAITAADVFEPSTPIRLKERRRRPNWSAAMALALAVIVGFVVYQAWPSSGVSRVTTQGAGSPAPRHTARTPQPSTKHRHAGSAHQVVIHLTAVEDCWVQLTTASGHTIFSGTILAGTAKRWTEHRAVSLLLGNPGGIALTVNGKNLGPPSNTGQPVTLSFGPGQHTTG